MIEIINDGPKKFILTCRNCGCKFTYMLEDIIWPGFIKCPSCKESIDHPNQESNPNPYTPEETTKINIPEHHISDFHYEVGSDISSSSPCSSCSYFNKLISGKPTTGDSPCDTCGYNTTRINF